ncbi:MAG: LysM peptidoglycan-binding domain-containing protein, partial [Chloroflexi bacterium]|nr:LysM peptidoglycan-binding domain-containing protein [Chloroflexota bacterium]
MKNRLIVLITALAILLLGVPSFSVPVSAAPGSYVIKQGDTLYSIARTLGVQLQALRDSNGIADPSKIRAGQVLTVPGSGQVAQAPVQASSAAPGSYVVRQGDTLYSIARSLGVQLQVLRDSNGIADPSKIRAGQVLTVPGSGQATPVATTTAAQVATPAATATVAPAAVQSVITPPGIYRAKSPEYGMNIFIMGSPATTGRDLGKLTAAGFTWQKTLFQWRQIEGAGKGQFNWAESDRVVAASNAAGVKIIARLDFQPNWSRADCANGQPATYNQAPPDNYNDYADFVNAFVNRYKTGSPYGRVQAIEIWNEPNLAREWGGQTPNAGQYVQLLKVAYAAAKRADPNVTVITAGLSPTETWNSDATPD